MISHHSSYHGATLGALALTGYTPLASAFDPMMRPMPKIPDPRAYLDHLDANDEATGHYYADMLEDRILAEGPETVLAFIVELVGDASTGALVPPASYMKRIREICTKYGVLLIHDEVMSGGGRTGKFFAAEHWNLAPDILTISKDFTAGYVPLGAMVARNDIVENVLDMGDFLHGYTYAGNPLACAVGLAVLDKIERKGMMDNATKVGAELKAGLQGLMELHKIIGDVRGIDLFLAFELVSNRKTLKPLPRNLNA
ncbi:aminotransferase class III-fold pyridoxal phosphate-dependent enzyme [Breoghania sp.]|uniref:aminotransferase class III-fold pyridoxal phosphate-dependent enzyme n=1 Tax=Breoghania sp. TaxID=2065378 RepID=UPI0032049FDA